MLTVFYDGWCPLCTAVARKTEKLDKGKKVAFASFREAAVVEQYRLGAGLQKRMQDRMYVFDGNRWYEGIHAVKRLALTVPAYWLAVPFLQAAIWTGLGQPMYDFIAKRRAIVPTAHCQDGVCEIKSKE